MNGIYTNYKQFLTVYRVIRNRYKNNLFRFSQNLDVFTTNKCNVYYIQYDILSFFLEFYTDTDTFAVRQLDVFQLTKKYFHTATSSYTKNMESSVKTKIKFHNMLIVRQSSHLNKFFINVYKLSNSKIMVTITFMLRRRN